MFFEKPMAAMFNGNTPHFSTARIFTLDEEIKSVSHKEGSQIVCSLDNNKNV